MTQAETGHKQPKNKFWNKNVELVQTKSHAKCGQPGKAPSSSQAGGSQLFPELLKFRKSDRVETSQLFQTGQNQNVSRRFKLFKVPWERLDLRTGRNPPQAAPPGDKEGFTALPFLSIFKILSSMASSRNEVITTGSCHKFSGNIWKYWEVLHLT